MIERRGKVWNVARDDVGDLDRLPGGGDVGDAGRASCEPADDDAFAIVAGDPLDHRAVANARADAEAMAQAAGGRLGSLIELSTQGPTVPPRPMFDLAARAKVAMAEPTPINPGQQTVTVFVTARWAFVPKS